MPDESPESPGLVWLRTCAYAGAGASLAGALAIGASCPGDPQAYGMFALDGAGAVLAALAAAVPSRVSSSWRVATGLTVALLVAATAFAAHGVVFGLFCAR